MCIRDREYMGVFPIIYYSTTPRIIAQQCEITDVENMLNKNKPQFSGTVFYKAIDEIEKMIQQSSLNYLDKFVIFLSDGGDGEPEKMLQSIQKINTNNYTNLKQWQNIGFGPAADASELSRMTDKLKEKYNCSYSRAINNVELQQTFEKISGYLQ
eukprot:TRINITY_DN5077_c0_g2_i1.p2 TRINITY_DN5077_c0_g2~~TRINITY_DN5077_c0_g2_i1.p2  ORF type:complete len:155 (+),score=30.74 TRINITY_DN5077_c0_g2_i1:184-648(+)